MTHSPRGWQLEAVTVDSIHLWVEGHCCAVKWQWHNTHLQPAMTQPDPVHSAEEIIFHPHTHTHTHTHTNTFSSWHLERWLRRLLLTEWQEWNLSQEYNYFCPSRHRSGISFEITSLSDVGKTRSCCSYTKVAATLKSECHHTMTSEATLFKQVIPPSLKKKPL